MGTSLIKKIDSNITLRRPRKNIAASFLNGDVSRAAAAQDLGAYGISIGDYATGNSGYDYILGDMDTFYGGYNSYAVLNTHHIALVVNTKVNNVWNSTNDTSTGYMNSALKAYIDNTVLPKIKTDIAALTGGAWNSHMLANYKLLTAGTSAWAWTENAEYVSALTSVQFHGSPICDMNFYSTGEANKPLEVFQKYYYPQILGNRNIWFRSIATAANPCYADHDGFARGNLGASNSFGVVVLILFY